MIALFNKLLDWFKALFWKEEMELTLVGLQYSGKTTFVNVIAVRAGAAGRRAGLSPPAADPGRRLARPGAAGRRSRRLGPSTARGDLRARAPLSCPAGMARLGGGGGGLETRMVPGTGGPEGSRGRRDPVPAPTGPLRARRGGMTGRKCRACPPRVRSAISARGLGGPAPGQPHPEALTPSRPKRKARAIEGEGRCPWHQRGRRGLALSASPPGGTAPRPRRPAVASQREFAVSSPQKLQEEALGARDELRGLCPLWDTAAKSELASVSRSVPGAGAKELKARGKGKTTPWCAS